MSSTTSPSGHEDPELIKVVLYQLSILLSTFNQTNFDLITAQIGYILNKYRSNKTIIGNFYNKLFTFIRLRDLSLDSTLTPIEKVFKSELDFISIDLTETDIFFEHLTSLVTSSQGHFNFIKFIEVFDCELILSFVILIKFEHYQKETIGAFIKENSWKLLASLKEREFLDNYNRDLVLDLILNTPTLPFIQKLLTSSSLKSKSKFNCEPITAFYKNILEMSFKQLLQEIGPEHLLPEKLLPSLLSIKPNEIDQSLALILADLLIPGSQNLLGQFNFANNLPEANAKGAQLNACFKSIDANPKFSVNWYSVFSHINEILFESSRRNIQPTIINITQFLSSLDFAQGVIDIFLSYDWWFNHTLLYFLHNMNPSSGAYDVISSKNITLGFDEEEINSSQSILKFINIAKLQLKVLTTFNPQKLQGANDPANTKLHLPQIFERDTAQYPQFLLAAALATVEKSEALEGYTSSLFSILLDKECPSIPAVLAKFKELDVQSLFTNLAAYYATKPSLDLINKILFHVQNIDLVDEFITHLESTDFNLAVKVLVASSNYGYDYKRKVEELSSRLKSSFFPLLLEAVDLHAQRDYERSQQQGQISQQSYHKILRLLDAHYWLEILKSNKGLLDTEKLKSSQLLILTAYPRLINFGYGHDETILKNSEASDFFSPEVEREMKRFYSRMYNKEIDIKEMVDMLIAMKSSDEPHKQDVFACMIHSLLDEYRFFAEYPLSALASTSLLFGALLEKDLIQGTTLTVALNFISESCNQPQDSHLFKFAVQSLYNFKSRLHEYPMYCKHLLECQSLSAHPKMFQIVKDAANGVPCTAPAVTPTPEVGPKYQSITIVDKTIGFVNQEEPSEFLSDKLLFLINNMTTDNMRVNDIKELLDERYFAWFSNYLVVDRAKAEPNNHELYSNFVLSFDNVIFFEYILSVSLQEVERIIRNFKDSSSERSQLKNLGAWLGKITLANDKPLRRDQIAFKFLLVEAFDFKSLPWIIPFVCKILDQAKYSKIFRPPNPWVLGIVKVLAELYECADLKLNLKFEIEVLLNSLNLKFKDIEPSTLIRSHSTNPAALAAMFGIHPETVTLANDISRLTLDSIDPTDLASLQQADQLHQPRVKQAAQPLFDTSFSNLIGNSIFTQHANLRRAFQASLTRSVRECALPILGRVSDAVLTTTEAMIKKDFATERDPIKFRTSYQNLAQQLCSSMVLCSGRKLLAETIESTMLQLLGSASNEFQLSELTTAIQANVGLCVEIVGKIALGQIADLIDERLKRQLTAREQHNPSEPFIDEGVSEYALKLPEPLGLSQGGLSAHQLEIYEAFGTNAIKPDYNQLQVQGRSEIPTLPGQISTAPTNVQAESQPQISQEDQVTFEQLFVSITDDCEKSIQLLNDVKETSLQELPAGHPIMTVLGLALTTAQNNALKYPELLLKAAQYAVNFLFTQIHENPMATEIYVIVLDRLCEFSPSTAKDVTWWLVHSSDQRKFNMPVMYALLKVQLVSPSKLDSSIGNLINESKNPVVIEFAASLLQKIFTTEEVRPVALRSDFSVTIAALRDFVPDENVQEQLDARGSCDKLFEILEHSKIPVSSETHSQLGYVFSEWYKLITHGNDTSKLQNQFIHGLLNNEILTNPEQFKAFFELATEVSVNSFKLEHEVRTRTQHETYFAVDALATLIVKLIFKFEDITEGIEYFKSIIGVILVHYTDDHESRNNLNDRAYFRFFSSLLCVWADESSNTNDSTCAKRDEEFYLTIGEVINGLQPMKYPGFTFSWVSLISHRMILPKLLELEDKKGYKIVIKFLTSLMKFQNHYYKDFQRDILNVLFKAINRIFTGITHDYPEFLVDCHYQLITSIPRGYIQLKNIILSSTPKDVIVPDPFSQGLKVERLPEINDSPNINYQPVEDLIKIGLKKPVDNFLRIPTNTLMKTIYNGLKLNHPREVDNNDYVHYNVKLVNALVLHVGISAVSERAPNILKINTKSSQVSLLVDLINHGSLEFKYHVINAIANQLRYPNSHTHWFVSLILHFFNFNVWLTSANKLVMQELITRVLLERRLVSKPHPWGLTIVFTEILRNGEFKFFDLEFVKAAQPELKALFTALDINVKNSSPVTSE